MSPETIFQLDLVLGYVAWLLCFGAYILPKLLAMDRVEAHRAIATLHSFRFFGLVFILPGVVGPHLPPDFASFAAYGDLATGVLAILALLTVRVRPLFWLFVVAFNVVGASDLILDYYHAISDRPSCGRWAIGCRVPDSRHLRPRADDLARGRLLFAHAPAAQGRLGDYGRSRRLAAVLSSRTTPPRVRAHGDARSCAGVKRVLPDAGNWGGPRVW